METFGRLFSILITVILMVFIPLSLRYSLEMNKNMESVENTLNELFERIKARREITASEMLRLTELSGLCGAKIQITLGIDRDIIIPEDNFYYGYREYMYTGDIEKIVSEEGKLILLAGDTLSLHVPVKKRLFPVDYFSGIRNKTGIITAGGVI